METEHCEVSGVAVQLTWMADTDHIYGGDYTYGWKATIGTDQYGNFVGGLFTQDEKPEAREVLLNQCALAIAAIKAK